MKPKDNSIDDPSAQTAGWQGQPGRELTNYALTLDAVKKRAQKFGKSAATCLNMTWMIGFRRGESYRKKSLVARGSTEKPLVGRCGA